MSEAETKKKRELHLTPAEMAERSISKRFRSKLWSPFVSAIKTYRMIDAGDKIAVCISGGKDSMLLAKMMQMLHRYTEKPFDLKFLVMDPGYNPKNRQKIEENAKLLEIPITIFETDIFEQTDKVEHSPCYVCARMRRGHLYSQAKKLGCNKIALGHHFDDVIETIVMGMLYGGQIQTMMPKLHSTNFEGMELIRPMVLIREKDIIHWAQYNKLSFIRCACRFTEQLEQSGEEADHPSKRQEVKELIAKLAAKDPVIENNIFRSVENVNLSTVVAYKKDGVKHHFLDDYDK